jgi:hypothetical protein
VLSAQCGLPRVGFRGSDDNDQPPVINTPIGEIIRRKPTRNGPPRRWAWWFGGPWLILVGAAWWFQSVKLLQLGLIAFGFMQLTCVIDGFRTGAIEGKWGLNERTRSPGLFWFFVVVHTVMGTGFVVGMLLRLTTAG